MHRALPVLLALAATAWANGFLVEGEPLPPIRLVSHRVTAQVHDRVAEVTVEQLFLNRSTEALEGTYLFPLPQDAAVGEFAMTIGDTLVRGEVLDAAEARAVYESIVRRRRDPGLLEYAGRGLFRARVFPLEPGKEVRVRLVYRHVLPEDAGTIEFRYPLATDRLNGAPVESLLVDVRFESSVDVKSVYSPSHAVAVRRDGARRAQATFERGAGPADRDLVLFCGRSAGEVGFTLLSSRSAEREGTFLAILAPPVAPDAGDVVPKDVVYVVDASGSMAGRKLVQAKLAVAHGIRQLRARDRFNVLAFASDWKTFRPGLAPVDDETVYAAEEWIDLLDAQGGTALEAALSTGLRMGEEGRLFLVVLVTDGRPTVGITGAEDILAQVAKANRARARVFTFGVGTDLDVALLDRIAEATGGERDYVQEHERIDRATGQLFARLDRPVLTDVRLEAGANLVQVYPRQVRDLFAGTEIVLMGRYAKPGLARIRLTGRRGDREVEYLFEGQLAASDRAPYLEGMWAQRKVAFLLDEIRLHGENPELVEEAKALGVRYQIVTPYTAGLVLEPDSPIRFASGRGGAFRGPAGGVPPGMREPADPEPAPPAAAGPTTPATPTGRSLGLKKRKDATVAADDGHARTAEGKTFRRDEEGRFVDTLWDGEVDPKRIAAYSEEYFALAARDDRVARWLAVAERVIFVFDGEAYEITGA